MANRVSVFCCSKKYNPFILKVNSGADSQITIPTNGSGYNYDLRVQGGQSWYGLTGNHTINFPSANTDYFIEISGEFPQIYINNNSEKLKFLDVVQWGDIVWKNFGSFFLGSSNVVISATDIPNVTDVSYYKYAFDNADLIDVNINSWDLTEARDIGLIFRNTSFNNGGTRLDVSMPNLGNGVSDPVLLSFYNTPIEELVIRDISYKFNWGSGTLYCPNLTVLELYGQKGNIDIRNTALTGTEIDDLANSVADMSGNPSPTITMTTAQYNSGIDTTIWTNKNWAIAQV